MVSKLSISGALIRIKRGLCCWIQRTACFLFWEGFEEKNLVQSALSKLWALLVKLSQAWKSFSLSPARVCVHKTMSRSQHHLLQNCAAKFLQNINVWLSGPCVFLCVCVWGSRGAVCWCSELTATRDTGRGHKIMRFGFLYLKGCSIPLIVIIN